MSVFKSYLRQLKALKQAEKNGDNDAVKRIFDELIEDARNGLEDG